jgi:Na+/melibiose symporter-like transporter
MNKSPSGFKPVNYVKITLIGLAFSALWQSLHTIILPLRLLDFVGEADKNTALGIITFSGLILAMLVQPLAGAISDRSTSSWGRRRPFILIGAVLALFFVPGIGALNGVAFIFAVYCLLQVSTNIAQGPYQGFIPDLVPDNRRGLACGVKSAMEIIGGAVAVLLISQLMGHYEDGEGSLWLWLSLGILMAVVTVAALITLLTVKEKNPSTVKDKTPLLKNLATAYKLNIAKNRAFMWFLASRLLIFMAFTTLQQFALYFLRDHIGVEDATKAAGLFTVIGVVFMLIATYPAGRYSDKIGRRSITIASGLVGAAGVMVIIVFQSYASTLVAAAIIGAAIGAFSSTNWALATDLLAKGEEARYLGIANMATAGGGALARLIGPVIDFFERVTLGLGYNVMLWACLVYFIIGALLVSKVKKAPSG